VSRLEYLLSSAVLHVLGAAFGILPIDRRKVVLATARLSLLEGNFAFLLEAMRKQRPDLRYVLLLEPYGYGLRAKLGYLLRVARGMYHLCTARLFVVDNAYLPVHVAPHRPGTTVVQVWHAVGALKRFGLDTRQLPDEPERTFLHRHYDFVVCGGEASRVPWSRALRTPLERVLPLGTPRTDLFHDAERMASARARVEAAYPALAGRRVVLYAPTFRGRGRDKRAADGLDARLLRSRLPDDHVLVLKSHPNLDRTLVPTDGFDVVVDPAFEMNDLLVATDVLVTDYSSSIFEFALLRRPIVLLVPDLEEYELDPGMYVDYRTEMVGTHVLDTDGVADTILEGRFDLAAYDGFIARHLQGCDGRASDRFVERFLAR
jgi:CDP-ribitol ribitolphosphotransferase